MTEEGYEVGPADLLEGAEQHPQNCVNSEGKQDSVDWSAT